MLAIRIAFTAQTEPIMAIMITPVYVSLIAVSLCIFILPFFVIGGLSKLFPDNDKVKALWDLLFIPIYRLQSGNKEKVITSPMGQSSVKREAPTLASTAGAWDSYQDEKKTKPKPKFITNKPKDDSPGLWDKVKSKIASFTSRGGVDDEDDLEPLLGLKCHLCSKKTQVSLVTSLYGQHLEKNISTMTLVMIFKN